jgi:AraC-like DNA-binding protein
MKSKWYELKPTAIQLRKRGISIGRIEEKLNISRSTLSGWFRDIELTPKQKKILSERWKQGLVKARKKALLWHRQEKEKRLFKAQEEADGVLGKVNLSDSNIIDLGLAMLYLGEGTKKNIETAMSNSDPLILKAFVAILRKNYNVSISKIRCELQIRADQNPQNTKRFWAKTLGLPMKNFKYINIDKRTIGTKTYPGYKGVCNIRCANVAIKRKLLNISKGFCEAVVKQSACSSVG